MTTFDKPIKEVTAEVLQHLVDDKVKEDLQLEYKEALPVPAQRDRFLKSIAAFANTSGGDLIYGVKAKRDDDDTPTGEAEEIVGLREVNLDQEKLRLDQWIRTCVDPPPPIQIAVIERGDNPPCLMVRVLNAGWRGLHIIKTLDNPFYGRNSAGKYPLSLAEIRSGFLESEGARERIRRFREERVNRILTGKTVTNLGTGPKIIFHALPITPDENSWARFVEAERNGQIQGGVPFWLQLPLIFKQPQRPRYNIDGFVVETLEAKNNYTQLFRHCGIESVDVYLMQLSPLGDRDNSRKVFYGVNVERNVINTLKRYQQICNLLGVTGPVALFLSITGVRGAGIAISPYDWSYDFIGIDSDFVMSDDVVLENVSDPADRTLKPLFDFMWNAGGYSGSPFYDENLSWVGDRKRS